MFGCWCTIWCLDAAALRRGKSNSDKRRFGFDWVCDDGVFLPVDGDNIIRDFKISQKDE
jgi:hypothetical protein